MFMKSSFLSSLTFVGAVCALAATVGCATSAPIPPPMPGRAQVTSIRLSQSVGQVGEPFSSEIELHAKYMGKTQMQVKSLPPGLSFDEDSRRIVGVPKSDGFFSVTVAVRKLQEKGLNFVTPDSGWVSERVDIDIYQPILDDETEVSDATTDEEPIVSL